MTDEELGLDFTDEEWELWTLETQWQDFFRQLNLAFQWRQYEIDSLSSRLAKWLHIRRSVNSTEVAAMTKHLKISPYDQMRGKKNLANERPSVMKLVDMLERKVKRAGGGKKND